MRENQWFNYVSNLIGISFVCRPEGDNRYLAVTQFEANAARRCFPCWDEPAIKATFSITLNVPADRTALSNMVRILLLRIIFRGVLNSDFCRIRIFCRIHFAESEYSAEYTLPNPNILPNIRHCRIMKKICIIKRVFNADV